MTKALKVTGHLFGQWSALTGTKTTLNSHTSRPKDVVEAVVVDDGSDFWTF